ncbi:MAG: glutamine-hydrolyzing GMP synthase, partial [Rickettsiales bacterium]|nr:glutamine-hydrolyzing GMP synthase [Rickettsiales bacterium]
WMSHGDHITSLPDGFEKVAESDGAPFAVIANEEKKFYGVQFHPEVTHTEKGEELLSNFALDVCGCQGNWNMSSFLEKSVAEIKEIVGDHKVICAVSGGVDSSVVATLIHKAIGDQLTCIFVDTGVLRKNEADIVKKRFEDQYHIPIHHVDASSIFLSELENIKDPEQKRKIIGKTFIDIFENEAKELGGAHFLAQGTLYPDVIESVSVHGDAAVTIKSYHNVGGLPDRMNMKLLEPVRELFKDEVRALGREMGMSDELIQRHPFPGPGLAIRLPGAITKERIRILQEADAIYLDEIRSAGLYDEIWQAFAVLLPVRTVGVMGDSRTYEYVCALRAVTSTDGMTADFYDFSHEFLRSVSSRIINNVKGINRVVYDISTKPPGTIEWE